MSLPVDGAGQRKGLYERNDRNEDRGLAGDEEEDGYSIDDMHPGGDDLNDDSD